MEINTFASYYNYEEPRSTHKQRKARLLIHAHLSERQQDQTWNLSNVNPKFDHEDWLFFLRDKTSTVLAVFYLLHKWLIKLFSPHPVGYY